MRNETAGAAWAATWRNQTNDVVGTTWGGTMCWFPRRPGRLRIAREGDELIVPCGECPGCLEMYRRRLADRLHAKYGAQPVRRRRHTTNSSSDTPPSQKEQLSPLYLVRIWAPQGEHERISRAMRRTRRLELETGFYRLGPASVAVLSREKSRIAAVLRARRLAHRIEPIRFRRGRRAWSALTGGMLIARSAYGENVNRYYALGLPAAERYKWDVVKRPYEKGYDRRTSPRVWRVGNLTLVPPEVWKLSRADRKRVREMAARAASPERVREVLQFISSLAATVGRPLDPNAPSASRLTRDEVKAWYAEQARRLKARTDASATSEIIKPLVGGAVTKVPDNTQSEMFPVLSIPERLKALMAHPPPPGPDWERRYADWMNEAAADGRPRWQAQEALERELAGGIAATRKTKEQAERDAWVLRMQAKAKAAGRIKE